VGELAASCTLALSTIGTPAAFAQAAPGAATTARRVPSSPHEIVPSVYYNNTRFWSNNDYTGYCGDTSGGYVALLQVYLMNDGLYPTSYKIDDYFGPATQSALLQYQNFYGLQRDGCAGPQTWRTMQNTAYYRKQLPCSNGSYVYVYGDGGTTDGTGGYFAIDYLWSFTTMNDVGGPVVPQYEYAFSHPLIGQNACIA
jgi:peptidoglycan hydrolase-like protein with peptidoglycan-binding domain